MRIAHVLRRISFDNWGGTEQVVWNLAKAQRAAGHEVRLFATTALSDVASENRDGIEISRFKSVYPWWPMTKHLACELDRKGGNPFVPGLAKALKEWKPDTIHCHAMGRIAEMCVRMGNGVKCVISLHGGGANVPGAEAKSLKAPTRGLFPWGKFVDYALGWTRRIPEDADGIVCVGEDEAEKYKAKHPHVIFLPNGVDTALFEGQEALGSSSPSGLVLLCVARIDRQKNQMMLVEALPRHPEAVLRLAGPVTQPDYLEELRARAKELGVEERFSYDGAFAPGSKELVREYRSADVFVLPSRHEPFGVVVLEAWAAGLPVIASDVGGLGRLVAAHPSAAIAFKSGDAESLDRALEKFAGGGTALRESMREAGREAAARYDWTRLSARLVDFYSSL